MNNFYEECQVQLMFDRQQIEQRLQQYQVQARDAGQDAWSVEVLVKKDRESLRRVLCAQERMAKGSYGVCLVCGKPIEAERLLAVATAETCITCTTKTARMQLRSTRH